MTPAQADTVFWLLSIPTTLLLAAMAWLRWEAYRRDRDEAP